MLPTLVISGPTASGKTSLAIKVALALAERGLTAEVVNADSMLIYKGMDIGTAKPTYQERCGIKHHLIDICEVTQNASVADFQQLARTTIKAIHERGGLPIVVGGSALYLRAITDDFEFPGTDPEVRARWTTELNRIGAVALHAKLTEIAPAVASDILPGNGRRIVRALEVIELTGSFTPVLPTWKYVLPGVIQFGLDLPREQLDERIAQRVHQMWQGGLLAEVAQLVDHGLRESLTAVRAIGYRQALEQFDGLITQEEAIAATIRATNRFARKQMSWFRRDHRIIWLQAEDQNNPTHILQASLDMKSDFLESHA